MATAATTAFGESISIGRIISRAFAVIASNPGVMFGIAFLFGALPSVMISYFSQTLQAGLANDPNGLRDGIFLTFASGIIALVLAMVVQGALVRATVAFAEGGRASFGESIAAGLRVVLPLIGLAIIVGLGVGFGLMFLLVPGIILYLMWAVAAPVLVEERTGVFGALDRSRALTKGARWKVFGLELIILGFYWLVSAVVGYILIISLGGMQTLATNALTGLPIGWLIVNAVIATLINTFWSAIQTALYIDLRDWKDGPATRHLEDVFA